MRDDMFPRRLRLTIATSARVAAMCLLAATAASAQPGYHGHCTRVGGSVMTNFIDATTTLGSATGDLRGAVSATLDGPPTVESDGTTIFTVRHRWTTEAGDTIGMLVARAHAKEVVPDSGLYAVISYPVTIRGGTGTFAHATGIVSNIGAIDSATGRTVFRYSGHVCFRGRPN